MKHIAIATTSHVAAADFVGALNGVAANGVFASGRLRHSFPRPFGRCVFQRDS